MLPVVVYFGSCLRTRFAFSVSTVLCFVVAKSKLWRPTLLPPLSPECPRSAALAAAILGIACSLLRGITIYSIALVSLQSSIVLSPCKKLAHVSNLLPFWHYVSDLSIQTSLSGSDNPSVGRRCEASRTADEMITFVIVAQAQLVESRSIKTNTMIVSNGGASLASQAQNTNLRNSASPLCLRPACAQVV